MIAAASYETSLFAYVFDKEIIEHENVKFTNHFLVRIYKTDEGVTRDFEGLDTYSDIV